MGTVWDGGGTIWDPEISAPNKDDFALAEYTGSGATGWSAYYGGHFYYTTELDPSGAGVLAFNFVDLSTRTWGRVGGFAPDNIFEHLVPPYLFAMDMGISSLSDCFAAGNTAMGIPEHLFLTSLNPSAQIYHFNDFLGGLAEPVFNLPDPEGPHKIQFSPDGLRFFLSYDRTIGPVIREYHCTAPWTLAGAEMVNSLTLINALDCKGFWISSDGLRLYTAATYIGGRITVFTLTTPWSLADATAIRASITSIPASAGYVTEYVSDILVSPDETKFWLTNYVSAQWHSFAIPPGNGDPQTIWDPKDCWGKEAAEVANWVEEV